MHQMFLGIFNFLYAYTHARARVVRELGDPVLLLHPSPPLPATRVIHPFLGERRSSRAKKGCRGILVLTSLATPAHNDGLLLFISVSEIYDHQL